MKQIFVLVMFSVLHLAFGQQINLEKIKENVIDDNSPFFYKKLVEDFRNNPFSIQSDSIKSQYLYYGKLYSGYYKKSSEAKSEYLKFMKQAGRKKYAKAINLGEGLLDKDPVNLTIILNLITCYKNSEKGEERVKELKIQAEILMKAIAGNGDGKSKETAFKVIALGDEFTLLNYLGIDLEKYIRNSEKQNSETILDIWTKDKKYQEDRRNKIYVQVFSSSSVHQ